MVTPLWDFPVPVVGAPGIAPRSVNMSECPVIVLCPVALVTSDRDRDLVP